MASERIASRLCDFECPGLCLCFKALFLVFWFYIYIFWFYYFSLKGLFGLHIDIWFSGVHSSVTCVSSL